jgi:hypothetical protein
MQERLRLVYQKDGVRAAESRKERTGEASYPIAILIEAQQLHESLSILLGYAIRRLISWRLVTDTETYIITCYPVDDQISSKGLANMTRNNPEHRFVCLQNVNVCVRSLLE